MRCVMSENNHAFCTFDSIQINSDGSVQVNMHTTGDKTPVAFKMSDSEAENLKRALPYKRQAPGSWRSSNRSK